MAKDLENLRKQMNQYAEKAGIKLDPDKKKVDFVFFGLLKKKQKFGEIYCPCRVVTGNAERDNDIVCPCVFHRGEIELQGHCMCELFVK